MSSLRPAGRPPFLRGERNPVSATYGLRNENDAGAIRVAVNFSRISSRPKGLGGQPAGAGYESYFSSIIRRVSFPCSVVRRKK